MGWLFVIPVFILTVIAMLAYLNSRRMLSRFQSHLDDAREQLEQQFHQRRNLLPSLIALGASAPGVEHECLETLDNAAELVIRSKGFEERMVAENRLSSALYHLRSRLEGAASRVSPEMAELVNELDDRESGLTVAGDLYNRQRQDFIDCLRKLPYRWLGVLGGYRPPHAIEIRLSTSPQPSKSRSTGARKG